MKYSSKSSEQKNVSRFDAKKLKNIFKKTSKRGVSNYFFRTFLLLFSFNDSICSFIHVKVHATPTALSFFPTSIIIILMNMKVQKKTKTLTHFRSYCARSTHFFLHSIVIIFDLLRCSNIRARTFANFK